MSYRAYMQIEQDKQRKAVDRYQRANIKSVEEAEKLAARYWNQFCEDKSEKNQRLMYWSRSVVYGAKIASGQVKRWGWNDNDEYEHQDKLEAMGFDV
jgi:hypothetical protein